jgi:DNA (cytosine-5)-methyltransferase 1
MIRNLWIKRARGPPCQDFSIVRGPPSERSGIKVSRGRLYTHFMRVLSNLRPRGFVFENVPGLKSANKRQAYRLILHDFSKGYEIIYSGFG